MDNLRQWLREAAAHGQSPISWATQMALNCFGGGQAGSPMPWS